MEFLQIKSNCLKLDERFLLCVKIKYLKLSLIFFIYSGEIRCRKDGLKHEAETSEQRRQKNNWKVEKLTKDSYHVSYIRDGPQFSRSPE